MELFTRLMDELDVTPEQAEGGAGALLQFAQARIDSQEFIAVADSIPAISDIIGRSPRYEVPVRGRLRSKLSTMFGGMGELAPLVYPFSRLHLEKAMIAQYVDVLLKYFDDHGEPGVQKQLSRVWQKG